jgi:hypothetical protein
VVRSRQPDPSRGGYAEGPARATHIDISERSAIARIQKHLPASEVPHLLKRRFQTINVWRPINNSALDCPLAFCDYRSVDKADTFPVTRDNPTYQGDLLAIRYNENQKWKYFYNVTPDEAVLIKRSESL